MWIHISTLPYNFMAYCLISSKQGQILRALGAQTRSVDFFLNLLYRSDSIQCPSMVYRAKINFVSMVAQVSSIRGST
jgi:hypothetical protein